MPPRKRKAAKKPSDDSDSFNDETYSPPSKSKKKEVEIKNENNDNDNQDEKNDEKNTSNEIIKEGANDLMHLPIEVIQEELIKRGYYPKMIKKFNQQYLVSILRNEASQVHETRRNRGDLVTKKTASMRNSHKNKPIFNPNDSGDDDTSVVPTEEEDDDENDQELPDVKANEFK